MMSTLGRLLSQILLLYMVASFVLAIYDREPVEAVVYAGFFVGNMLIMQLDELCRYLKQVLVELKRQGVE